MPTDKNTALRILVRKGNFEKEEWLRLIEARRALIKKYLDTFTLSELGEIECLECNNSYHRLHDNEPEIISDDEKLSLEMQGIFHPQPWNKSKYDFPRHQGFPDGTIQIWGLARSGHWIIAKVSFTGEAGYKHRGYQRAKTVKIEKTNLATIIAKTGEKPIEIWKKLGESVKEWTKKRKKLYEHALEINDIIKTENKVLSLITFFPIFD